MKPLVLFDCDGVLIDSEEIGYYVLRDALAEQGVSYERVEYVEMLSGMTDDELIAKLKSDHPHLDDQFFAALEQKYNHAMETQVKVIDGVIELLQTLKDHGIPFAVCSNSDSNDLLHKLRKHGLYDYFSPHIYSKNHVDNPKPAPDIFLQAAKDRGYQPEDCIVIEDTVTGTLAGVKAGASVIGYIGEQHRDDEEADLLCGAGAKMLALSMEDVWNHIAHKAGLDLSDYPFLGKDLEL